mmetsp:Transcript_21431/g.20603  ORF Transcript_21431/g.20603 Transcript_21431/m.20603 type:complete len:118 (-) Transcript_21431:328-681(-)
MMMHQKLFQIKNGLFKEDRTTDEEIQAMKTLIRDVIQFKDMLPTARNELAKYITFVEKEKDELIIQREDNVVDMYVILKGKIKLSAYKPSEVHKELFERNQYDIISQINLFKTLKDG